MKRSAGAWRFGLGLPAVVLLSGCTETPSKPPLGVSAVPDRAGEAGLPPPPRDGAALGDATLAEGGAAVTDGVACFRYVAANCEHNALCRRLPRVAEGCLQLARDCPSAFLVEGSSRTRAGLLSCALEYPDFDCARLLRGESPACATPGTLPAGAVCKGHMACISTYCDEGETSQRTCHALAESGESCVGRVQCPPGDACSADRCTPITELTLESGNAPQSGQGEPCRQTSYCQEGLYCLFADSIEIGSCARPPMSGEACVSDRTYAVDAPKTICELASYCASDGICRELPGVGESCAARSDGLLPVCRWGSYCDDASGVCVQTKGALQMCTLPTVFSSLSGVPRAPECDWTLGLRCVCEQQGRGCGPDEGVCLQGVSPGEECGFEATACLYGSVCLDGICDYP
jgi:hypothetical protein